MDHEAWKQSVRAYERRHRLLSSLVIGTAIVLFWRGVWLLADAYLFPGEHVASAAASVLIAVFILYMRDFDLLEIFDPHPPLPGPVHKRRG